ncbi:response regulator transcription factor [Candidatus Microgenomates bacterium]|nr:response regulator transcription factor [Candidatus Microgenomates bacterium]
MAKVAMTVLVIEDDNGVRTYLRELLLDNGYNCQLASDGASGLVVAEKLPPDLVILDLGLPNMSGETVCQELRKSFPKLPIIILTAKDGTANVIAGFNLGADDYVTKPFVGSELLARIKARLKPGGADQKVLKVADLELDPKTLEVKRGKKQITLTRHEFELLKYLMTNPDQVLSREMILNRVWSYSPDVESRVVDIYIGYLRKKIDKGHNKPLLHSNRGFGYSLKG